jgi:hypothetical protein
LGSLLNFSDGLDSAVDGDLPNAAVGRLVFLVSTWILVEVAIAFHDPKQRRTA